MPSASNLRSIVLAIAGATLACAILWALVPSSEAIEVYVRSALLLLLAALAGTTFLGAAIAPDQEKPWYLIGFLLEIMVVAYWNTLLQLFSAWKDPQYSHGWLVPIFTAVFLAIRRQPFTPVPVSNRWAGVAIIAIGLAARTYGALIRNDGIELLSIMPVLFGIFIVAGGWSMMRWAAAPLAFSAFMMPLPDPIADRLLSPLQHVATVASTYVLQTLGVVSFYIGNKILIGDGFPLNVEEQCSGLRMCTIFLAMAVAMTMITERPWWQNVIVILSSIPIAVAVNLIRIVITALLYQLLGPDSELAKHFFHDLAGWFMMPLAFVFLYLEMQFLDHVLIEETSAAPVTIGFGKTPMIKRPAPTRIQ
jgi:exosortase